MDFLYFLQPTKTARAQSWGLFVCDAHARLLKVVMFQSFSFIVCLPLSARPSNILPFLPFCTFCRLLFYRNALSQHVPRVPSSRASEFWPSATGKTSVFGGLVNFVFVNWLRPLNWSKLADSPYRITKPVTRPSKLTSEWGKASRIQRGSHEISILTEECMRRLWLSTRQQITKVYQQHQKGFRWLTECCPSRSLDGRVFPSLGMAIVKLNWPGRY